KFPDIARLFVRFLDESRERMLTPPGSTSRVRRMTDDRMSGLALIASSVAGIITMSLHPTGHDLFVPGQLDSVIRVLVAVHALALVSLPVCFLGALGLSRRLAAAD